MVLYTLNCFKWHESNAKNKKMHLSEKKEKKLIAWDHVYKWKWK